MSMASPITPWAMRNGPRQPGAAPSTTISWSVSSTPAEAEAREENSDQSRPIASSVSALAIDLAERDGDAER